MIMKYPSPKENIVQMQIVTWMSIQYPNVIKIHIANERKCSIARGSRLKRMGQLAGASDLFIPEARGIFHGMFLEVKRDSKCKATPKQQEFLENMKERGYFTAVGHGFDESKQIISEYLRK